MKYLNVPLITVAVFLAATAAAAHDLVPGWALGLMALAATAAAAHDLVPGWALGLMALAGIALIAWADPREEDHTDQAAAAQEVGA